MSFTHDSIGLGEDGPTHQPVEHAASLPDPESSCLASVRHSRDRGRLVAALERTDGPTALLLSRQTVPFSARESTNGVRRGGYVLSDAPWARAALIATGSEVPLALAAQKILSDEGVGVRVVSMPSTSVFDRQDAGYRDSVLPRGLPRVAVKRASPITGASMSASMARLSASIRSANRRRADVSSTSVSRRRMSLKAVRSVLT
jgi:transketolase